MLLRMNGLESSVLLLQMAISRKKVKNTFKRNYSKDESKVLLASFDEIKEALEIEIEQTSADSMDILIDYHFNIKEIELLSSYLENYVPLLEKTLQQAGSILKEDHKQIDTLHEIKKRTSKLLEVAYA